MEFYEKILVSPISGKAIKKLESRYLTEDMQEEYTIINDIPALIKKENLPAYFNDTYRVNFKYFKYLDLAFIKVLCKKIGIKMGSVIADIGGGEGFYSHCLAKCGMYVINIDFSKYLLEKGLKRYRDVIFIAGDAKEIPLLNDSMDLVYCSGLSLFNTKEIRRKNLLIQHILSKLKQNGLLIFCYSTNLSGKQSKNWYNITKEDFDELFKGYNIISKWFMPRLFIPVISNSIYFNTILCGFFSRIIKILSPLNMRIIRGRLIYVIKK